MSSSEYPEAVLEYVQAQGWNIKSTELREGTYLVAGSRENDSGSKKMLLMIVCGPESEVTTEHVEYLLKAAKQKNANAAALTADIGITSEAQRAIEESSVSIIDESTVTSKASTQTVSSLNEPLKSSTANTVRSPAASEKSQEEMSKSEINNKYFQFAYLSFLFGLSL